MKKINFILAFALTTFVGSFFFWLLAAVRSYVACLNDQRGCIPFDSRLVLKFGRLFLSGIPISFVFVLVVICLVLFIRDFKPISFLILSIIGALVGFLMGLGITALEGRGPQSYYSFAPVPVLLFTLAGLFTANFWWMLVRKVLQIDRDNQGKAT